MEIITHSTDSLFSTRLSSSLGDHLTIAEAQADDLPEIALLNDEIFQEERIINSFDRDDLLMLVALYDDEPIGFKIGYRENRFVFYSAKGGVKEQFRRQGVGKAMLYAMVDRVQQMGYKRLAYDTFPNMHPAMTIMGLREGYSVVRADFNHAYHDFRIRFEKKL